jgi:predicted O-linked N-acetylglucosamine transferase (SPINDLY family)
MASAGSPSQLLDAALEHHRAGRLPQAESFYREVLRVDPKSVDALHFLGVLAYQGGKHGEAEDLISSALRLNPSNPPAHNNLGNALAAQGKLSQAIASFVSALALDPTYVDALVNMGSALTARGELGKAISCFQRALALAPGTAAAQSGLRNAIESQSRVSRSSRPEDRSAESPAALLDAGNALKDEGRLDEAVASYRKALSIDPGFSGAYVNLGNVLHVQGKTAEAITSYQKALAIDPNFLEAHFNLANTYRDQNELNDAVTHYERSVAIRPDFPDAYYALGHVFRHQGRHKDSLACYQKALALDPEYVEARWGLAISQVPKMYDLDTEPSRCIAAFSEQVNQLDRWFDGERAARGFKAVGSQQPFALAYHEANNRNVLERYGRLCARLMGVWFERQGLASAPRPKLNTPLRVGFVSQYFWNHSVWNAIVKGWFQMLDRDRFAIYGFYLGHRQDEETALARSSAEHFEEGARDLRQWVRVIVDQQLDVLIYPEIGMDPMTLQLASLRLAPVQAVTWGHPETTGLPTIDYYLSARDFEPTNAQEHYSERLVALPNLGCFYEPLASKPVTPDLSKMGIETDQPLLLCPGMPFKYAPQFDWVLAEIAHRAGRCQFVFFTPDTASLAEMLRVRLESAFAERELDFKKFGIFIPWLNGPAFDGLMKRADLFLDTIGFSGFNTAMQAVECGLPIVTRDGRFMRGRLASGILKRMGLQELVAGTEQEYVELALKIIRDDDYRASLRNRLASGRSMLYADEAPIRGLEDFLLRAAM